MTQKILNPGQILTGTLFNEPMRVETVHDDVLNAIEDPDYMIEGYAKAFIALKKITKTKFLAVVYREVSKEDGFVITAYFTSKLNLEKEVILWEKKS